MSEDFVDVRAQAKIERYLQTLMEREFPIPIREEIDLKGLIALLEEQFQLCDCQSLGYKDYSPESDFDILKSLYPLIEYKEQPKKKEV